MESLKSILQQARETWNHATRGQQATLLAGGLLTVIAIIGVGVWASRPVYVPFANNLSPAQAMHVVSQLEAAGVNHRLSFSARQVLVPKSEWTQAQIAAGDLVDHVPENLEELEDGPFVNPELLHTQMMRQQEALLARTIAQIESIESATVHVSRPEPSPFVRDREAVTASVVLKIARGRSFSREQAAAVVALVNHGVEGLTPDNITLLDTEGRMLSSDGGFDSSMDGQLDYRRRLEADLAAKAEVLLAQLLGPGRSIVRLTTDIDFNESSTKETLIDPDASAPTKEEIELTVTVEETRGGAIGQSGGPAGSSSNIDPAVVAPAGPGTPMKTERNSTEYENSSTTYNSTERAGTIKRLTVAAIVDLPEPGSDGEQGQTVTKDQVEMLIKQAVGFDSSRDDQVEVVVGELTGIQQLLVEEPAGVFAWPRIENLVRNASLGLASLVVLVLGVMIVRRLRPVTLPQPSHTGLSESASRKLLELSQEARMHPDQVASVISEWLNNEDDEASPPVARRSAA